jgi:DNA repair protein RadC
MTNSPTPYDAIRTAVRHHPGDHGDGALFAVFLDRQRTVLLTIGFEEGTKHVDELFLRHLIAVVSDLRVAAVVFAVRRESGRPTRIDKLLWHELSARVGATSTQLLDVVVIGELHLWSAATGRVVPVGRGLNAGPVDPPDRSGSSTNWIPSRN